MPHIKVVWGPPAAGKSTHVNDNKGDNDLIFDFDLLMRDLSGLEIYARNENLINYLVDFRQQIADALEGETRLDAAWLIISFPEGELKAQLEGLGAEFILIYEDKDTCLQRVEDDERRKDKAEWHRVVEDWFEKYEEASKAVTIMPKPNKRFWNFKALGEKTGELTLYGIISNQTWWDDEVTPKRFKEDLDALGDIDTLNVYINSPGGDVFAGQAIHSILKRHKAAVNIYVDGLAASTASVVAMAGDTVTMPKNAMMMVHNPWSWSCGNAGDFRKLADDLDKIRESMIAAYLAKASDNLDRDKLIEIMDAETWLTAEECLKYGFCDEIEESKQVAACLDKEILGRYKNTPKGLLAEPEPEPEPDPGPGPDKEVKARELKKRLLALELELA